MRCISAPWRGLGSLCQGRTRGRSTSPEAAWKENHGLSRKLILYSERLHPNRESTTMCPWARMPIAASARCRHLGATAEGWHHVPLAPAASTEQCSQTPAPPADPTPPDSMPALPTRKLEPHSHGSQTSVEETFPFLKVLKSSLKVSSKLGLQQNMVGVSLSCARGRRSAQP